jgi:6-pyruvoyltetrahydropterin/6-carboxytetrahydropterin synthase
VFVEATSASGLDRLGRVIDFAVLKERIGSWIDEHWDHGFIIWKEDTDALAALRKFAELDGTDQKVFLLDSNPTAENLAEFLLAQCRELLHDCAVEVQKVVVWETENCFAEACW